LNLNGLKICYPALFLPALSVDFAANLVLSVTLWFLALLLLSSLLAVVLVVAVSLVVVATTLGLFTAPYLNIFSHF
jgi:hypothetical protein